MKVNFKTLCVVVFFWLRAYTQNNTTFTVTECWTSEILPTVIKTCTRSFIRLSAISATF